MKRALGYGLILLAASQPLRRAPRWRGAMASEVDPGAGGALFFFGGSASARGAQGYLGVIVRDVTPDQVAALKLKDARGAEIVLVDHDAPAGKAGLREHDVVLQMNGQAIEGGDQIRKMLHECPAGKDHHPAHQPRRPADDHHHPDVDAGRGGAPGLGAAPHRPRAASTRPPTAPTSDFSAGPASSSPRSARGNSFIGTMLMNPSYTGAMLEKMSTQLADYFGVSSGAGLLVRSVAAELARRPRRNARRRRCRRRPTPSPSPAPATGPRRSRTATDMPLTIVVMRDKKQQTLTLTPDGKKRSSLEQPIETLDHALVAHLGFPWMGRS